LIQPPYELWALFLANSKEELIEPAEPVTPSEHQTHKGFPASPEGIVRFGPTPVRMKDDPEYLFELHRVVGLCSWNESSSFHSPLQVPGVVGVQPPTAPPTFKMGGAVVMSVARLPIQLDLGKQLVIAENAPGFLCYVTNSLCSSLDYTFGIDMAKTICDSDFVAMIHAAVSRMGRRY